MWNRLRLTVLGLVLFCVIGGSLRPGEAQRSAQDTILASEAKYFKTPAPIRRQTLQNAARLGQDRDESFQANPGSGEHDSFDDTDIGTETGMNLEARPAQSDLPGTFTLAANPHPQSAGLIINATFDSSITSDPNAAAIEAMISRAVALYEAEFSDPITVSILFRYATTAPNGSPLSNGLLARSNFVIYTIAWNTFTNALIADGKTANDSSALSSLPANPLTSSVVPSGANGRALGLNTPPAMFADSHVAPGGQFDGIVTINANKPFQFDRGAAIPAGIFDAQRSTEHEIDEVLGLGSILQISGNTNVRPQDLFTWSSSGTRNLTGNGNRYFSIDRGATDIVDLNQESSGDFGDWLSGPCPQSKPFVQNAFSCSGPGQVADVTATSPEGINLDVIGYDLVTVPQQMVEFSVDDGSFESATTLTNTTTVFGINRITPDHYPATLSQVAIFFQSAAGLSVGEDIKVVIGTNPGGRGGIDGTALQSVSASIATLDDFNIYSVPSVTINSGDFLVGVRVAGGPNIFPLAEDTDAQPQRRSYISSDGVSFSLVDDIQGAVAGNFGIRAEVSEPASIGSSPSIANISGDLEGNVLTLTGTALDSGADMTQFDITLRDLNNKTISDSGPQAINFGALTSGYFTVRISNMNNVPTAVSATMSIIDRQGLTSAPIAVSFGDSDPGGPGIVNVGLNDTVLVVKGAPFFGNLQLELNGVIVAPPLVVKVKGGGVKLKIGGVTVGMGATRVRILADKFKSNIFVLTP